MTSIILYFNQKTTFYKGVYPKENVCLKLDF